MFRKYEGEATIYDAAQEPAALYQTDIEPGAIWTKSNSSGDAYVFIPQGWLDQYGVTADVAADATYANGGWVKAHIYWLRSPNLGSTSTFWIVNANGGLNFNLANNVNGLVPGFSI